MTRKYGPTDFQQWKDLQKQYGLDTQEVAERVEASETTVRGGFVYLDGFCGAHRCKESRVGEAYYCAEHQAGPKRTASAAEKEVTRVRKESLGICTYGSCRADSWGNQSNCKWHYFRTNAVAHIKTDSNKGLSAISAEELADLALEASKEAKEICPLTDVEMVPGEPMQNSPTIDEIIPGRGHVKGNVQVISWQANSVKSRFYYKKGVFSIPVDFFERVKDMQIKAEESLTN